MLFVGLRMSLIDFLNDHYYAHIAKVSCLIQTILLMNHS